MIKKYEIKKRILLSFDLDFTLIDNRTGIIESFNHALGEFNEPQIDNNEIEGMIGLPLEEMFSRVTDIEPSTLASAFRRYYGTIGIYKASILPGVIEKLEDFKSRNYKMGIITSKKEEMAKKIVEILEISQYFDYILGETEDRKHLGKLDPELKHILSKNYPHYQIIVIGDHPKDVLLSNNMNCPFIGVLTGIHSATELGIYKSNKIVIINSVKDLTPEIIESIL